MNDVRFEVFKSTIVPNNPTGFWGDRWYWRLRARNAHIIAVSEGYSRRSKAIEAARMVARTIHESVVDVVVK